MIPWIPAFAGMTDEGQARGPAPTGSGGFQTRLYGFWHRVCRGAEPLCVIIISPFSKGGSKGDWPGRKRGVGGQPTLQNRVCVRNALESLFLERGI